MIGGRTLLGVLTVCTWLSTGSLSRAEPPRVSLELSHPVGSMCPSGRMLASDVEELAGRAMFGARRDADVLVVGQIIDAPSGVVAQLEARSADGALLGSRELRAPAGECASLRRSLALVLTLLLDEEAEREARPVARSTRLLVGVGTGLLSSTLPRATAGFSLAVAVDPWPALRVRMDTSYWLPVVIETERGVGARLGALGSELSVCPRLSSEHARLGFWLCGGAQLGGLWSTPRGLEGPERQVRLLAQLTVALRASLRLSRNSAVEASLGPALALSRPRFRYEATTGIGVPVHRPSVVGTIVRLSIIIDGL